MLTYADVFWRTLTFADVCRPPQPPHSSAAAAGDAEGHASLAESSAAAEGELQLVNQLFETAGKRVLRRRRRLTYVDVCSRMLTYLTSADLLASQLFETAGKRVLAMKQEEKEADVC